MAISYDQPSVAFIGLGAMGFAMSTHLVRQGIPVTGYDIWKPSLEKFESTCSTIPGATYSTASSPSEAVRSASVVLLMVATHHHVNSALFDTENGAIKSLPQDCTIIIASTVPPTYPPEVRKRLDGEFARPDVKLIDAPVSGGTVRSANGTLTIMSSSNDESNFSIPTVKQVLTNLASNGKTLFTIPGALGSGTSAKALNQVQCGIHIVAGSEVMALAAIAGLNTSTFYQTMKERESDTGAQKYGWTWMFENRGPRMLDTSLPISSAVSIINKDVGIIKDEEDRLDIELPLLNKAHALLGDAMKVMASLDDAWLSQFYLGLESPRKELVIEQTKLSTETSKQDSMTLTLLLAHAIINFESAFETFKFAEALDLLGEEQRKMWFDIIAGAAGASRVFSEVIPQAFNSLSTGYPWQDGFRAYAKALFSGKFKSHLPDIENLIVDAKKQDFKPVLLESALTLLKKMVD